jgi:Uma2 family endonuclease
MTPSVAPAPAAAPPFLPAAVAPPPVVPPPAPARPVPLTPHRWTLDEYRQLYKTGLFADRKVMLLDGELYVMPMPGPPHDASMTRAFRYLLRVCPADHYVRNQQAFFVGTRHDPGPDLAVVPGDYDNYLTDFPKVAALIVEVAHTTLATDVTVKAETYATAGVPDYWVIDVENRQLLVFRDPVPLPEGLGATAYRSHVTLNPDDTVAPLMAPAAAVRVADLLP